MREVWPLPEYISNTGPEWLFQALDKLIEQGRMMMLMTFWRIWHVRNEVIHDKKSSTGGGIKEVLCSYVDSLLTIKQHPAIDPTKGRRLWPMIMKYRRSGGNIMQEERKRRREPGPNRWVGG
jgi:hypothetical protein